MTAAVEEIIIQKISTPGMQYWEKIEESLLAINIDINDYGMTEDEGGRMFIDIAENWFRYNTTERIFKIWTGTHWQDDNWKLAERSASYVGQIFQSKLATITMGTIKEATYFIKKLRSSSGIKSILYFASSDPRIVTSEEDYNRHEYLLNTPGGTYDFTTGKIREHRRNDLLTKITRYAPDSKGGEKFINFLNLITLNRNDLQEALQIYIGSGAVGQAPKDKILCAYGSGQNGKSVLIEGAGDCLGDYCNTLDIKNISGRDEMHRGHTDELAHLAGCRFCISGENNLEIKIDESKVKRLTGGDTIPVSKKHGRTFDMRPAFSLVILTNHKPRITGRDTGIWRRMALFPFDYIIPDGKKKLNFKTELLKTEGSFFMNWIIEGGQKFYADGYGKFDIIENATEEYRKEENTIGRFIDECCTVEKFNSIKAGWLWTAYQDWCRENGEHVFSGKAFREAMQENGIKRKHTRGGNFWEGLTLNDDSYPV